MKKIRLSVITFCVLCLVIFVFCNDDNGNTQNERHKIKSHPKVDCKVMSILGKVQEYQDKLIMYRKMYIANKDMDDKTVSALEQTVKDKLKGFIIKLELGNGFSCTPAGKEERLTRDEIIAIWSSGSKAKFKFELESMVLTNIELPPDASDYVIDCSADVTLIFHHVTEHNQDYRVNMRVDHMKVCEPD